MQKDNISTWSHPPVDLDLQPHQVDIWRVFLGLPDDTVKSLFASLSADETQRAARFHFPADRDRFIIAHACLRAVLAHYLHCAPDQLNFSTGEYGKPILLSDKSLDFNLSHSGDYALIAVTRECKVGIDVERIRQGVSHEGIAHRYFSRREISELVALPPEERRIAFFNGWTRKEAYIKAHGLGLSLPLNSFDVSLTPNEAAMLRATRPDQEESARWTLMSLEVVPDYAGALAVEGQGLEFRLWDWNVALQS